MHSSDLLPAAFAGAMLIVVVCVVLIGYAIQVFVCWNLMGCLQRLPAQYRKMELRKHQELCKEHGCCKGN